jgi:Ni/Co efflux regulator RcnB
MRRLLLAALAGLVLAGPVLAREDRREWREDRREWREDRRDWQRGNFGRGNWQRNDWRYGNWRNNDWRWQGTRYRGPVYVHPYGYNYRPWNIGYRLPPAYFGQRYWIGDPGYYRLPPAYRGTRWVRVGPDALLISVHNGVVVRAVRGLYG